MVWLKGCPRCKGDLRQMEHFDGVAIQCLQCAREWPLSMVEHLLAHSLAGARPNAGVGAA